MCGHETAECIEAFGVCLEPGKQRKLGIECLLKRDIGVILWVAKARFLEEGGKVHQRKARIVVTASDVSRQGTTVGY